MLYFLVDILSIKKRHHLIDAPNMVCETQFHCGSYIDAFSAIILLPQRYRGMGETQVVESFEQIQRCLHRLSGSSESHRPAPDPGIEKTNRQVVSLDS